MPRKYFFVNYWAFFEIAKTIFADFITKINKKLLLIEFVQFANNGVNFMLFGNPSKLHVIGHFLAIIIFWGSLNLYQYHQNSDFFWWGETRSIKKHHFLLLTSLKLHVNSMNLYLDTKGKYGKTKFAKLQGQKNVTWIWQYFSAERDLDSTVMQL